MKLKIENKKNFYIIIAVILFCIILFYILLRSTSRRVASYAKRFVGEEEIRGNLGFKDPEFEKMMKNVGWLRGQAWCMYFAKVIWIDKYKNLKSEINQLLSGGTVSSFNKVKNSKSKNFAVTSMPRIGDIAVWQKYTSGKATGLGHSGIVTKVRTSYFETIEGNTDDTASREGYKIAKRKREFDFNKTSGLRLLGFITKV